MLLVNKPSGKVGLRIDHLKFNAVTKSHNYPLLKVDDMIHGEKYTSFMSKINSMSRYMKLELLLPNDMMTVLLVFISILECHLDYAPISFQRLVT